MDWKQKVVIITGATTGIGKATQDLLRQRGCIVYNLDVYPPAEVDPHYIPCDVRDNTQIRAAVAKVVETEKHIDMLFANAGVHLFASIEETSDEQLENILAINIKGVFVILKAVLPVMKAQGKGSVVLMGSDQSFIGKASSAVYGLTKGAIGQLTKSTAIDYAKHNIRVNCICPGTIDTPLLHNAVNHYSAISGTDKDDVYQSLKTVQPLNRIGAPEEIAASVAFLLSDESGFTTGALLSVDGGYICQ